MSIKELCVTLEEMHCETCASGIQKVVCGMEGVLSATVGLKRKKLFARYDEDVIEPERILSEVESIGYRFNEQEKAAYVAAFSV